MPEAAHHTSRQVPLSDADKAHLGRLLGAGYATNWGCLLVFAVLVGTGLVFAGRWGASLMSAVTTEAGGWIGALLAGILLARVITQAARGFQADRRNARADLDGGVAEEIEIRTTKIVLLGEEGTKTEPRLALEIGGDKLLVLAGFWLQRPHLYGAPRDVAMAARRNRRAHSEFVNLLPPPWSFPCSEFTVRRLPKSGVVLAIQNRGEPRVPTWMSAPGLGKQRLPQSLVVDGTLDDVEAAVTARLAASDARM